MNFELNEEQSLLKESLEKFLQENYEFSHRQKTVQSAESFDTDIWLQCAELGWLYLPFAEDDGGLGGSVVDTMILFEALGRYMVVEPFLETLVLTGGILRRSRHPRRASYLEALMMGELQGAVAHFESNSRGEHWNITSSAEPCGSGYRLSGSKAAVYNAEAADIIVVSALSAQNGDGRGKLQLFLVPKDTADLQYRCYDTVDGRRAADISFADVDVAADSLLAEGDEAIRILQDTYDEALLALAAESQGAMEQLLLSTVEYTRERKQFGTAISNFQVLQHRMVNMLMAKELSRSLLYAATIKFRDQSDDAHAFVAAAKVKADRCAKLVAEGAVQLHGAIATTDELAVGHYLKRITIAANLFGSSKFHLRRFASLSRQLTDGQPA